MKGILEYIYESDIINIFESLNLKTEKNIDKLYIYLSNVFDNIKCIKCDDKKTETNYNKLSNWFIENDNDGKPFFYLKSNGKFCINGNYVNNTDDLSKYFLLYDNESGKYNITYKENNNQLINIKLYVTHKHNNIYDKKIWPSDWEIIKSYGNNLNFGNKGAYKIAANGNNILNDLKNVFDNYDDENIKKLSNIFIEKNFKNLEKYIKDNNFSEEFEKYNAKVLSEPIALISSIFNINNILDKIKENKEDILKDTKLTDIIIPIAQNWKDADFYLIFKNSEEKENNLGIPISISVKSGPNGGGAYSSVLSSLQYINIEDKNYDLKNLEEYNELFKEVIPLLKFNTKKTLNKDIVSNNSAYFILSKLIEQCKSNINQEKKMYNAYKQIILPLKDKYNETYEQLYLILNDNKNGRPSYNLIERIFCLIFNANENVLNIIQEVVSNTKANFKIDVNDNGNIKLITQFNNRLFSSFKLYPRITSGHFHGTVTIENNKIINIETYASTDRCLWFGYKFN